MTERDTDTALPGPEFARQDSTGDGSGLTVTVTAPMPLLNCVLDPPPQAQLLHGEICKTALVLENVGTTAMTSLRWLSPV